MGPTGRDNGVDDAAGRSRVRHLRDARQPVCPRPPAQARDEPGCARRAAPLTARMAAPRHLYLHIPYCAAKCPYCDFNSIAGREAEHAAYVAALLAEVGRLPAGPYDTVFVGGGTPSLLAPALLATLLTGL